MELIAAVIITAGLRSSMVLQVLSCGSAAWSDSTACRKYSTPASLVPSCDALLHRTPEGIGQGLQQHAEYRLFLCARWAGKSNGKQRRTQAG